MGGLKLIVTELLVDGLLLITGLDGTFELEEYIEDGL